MSGNAMQVGSFLNFGIENAKRHWLKFFGLLVLSGIAICVVAGLCFGASAALPDTVRELGMAVSSLVTMVVAVSAAFGVLKNVLNLCRGEKMDIMAIARVKPMTILNFVIATILMFVLISIGFVLLIIPGIILMLMFMYVPYLIIDRDMGFVEAFLESMKISKGRKMDVFVGFFISAILTNIASMFIITIIFTIPMMSFIYVYPYLALTGQLDEAQKKLAAADHAKNETTTTTAAATPTVATTANTEAE
jgi:hypothetical protein